MKIETATKSFFINDLADISHQTAILFLGGELQNEALARELASISNLIVCADTGAEHAIQLGIIPNAIIGDLDSVAIETLNYFEKVNCKIVRVPDQESNDFEKALIYLLMQFENQPGIDKLEEPASVFVFGMTGGRTDHTIANFSVMLRYTDRFENLIAFELGAEHRFLTTAKSTCRIECEMGTTISLAPFGKANGIVTENLKYPLMREALFLGIREGVSNRATGSPVAISIKSGALLVTVLSNR